jgi:hypothetical protein
MSNNQETSFKHIIDINLEQYSEKCFILTGNTIKHKQDIKELGGKWNPSLKAWIFPNMKREVIDKWLETGEKTVEPIKQYFENPVYNPSVIPSLNPSVNPSVNPVVVNESKSEKSNESKIERRLEILEWKMDRMIDLLLELKIEKTERNSKRNESKVALSEIESKIQPKLEPKIESKPASKIQTKIQQGIEYDDITFLIPEDEEEVNVPRKRLLRR